MLRKRSVPAPDPPRDEPEAPVPIPSRRFTDQASQSTVILPGLVVKGEIAGGDSVDLGGIVQGDIRIEGLCRVREKARVEGDISATQVLVEGSVEGRKITATGKIELRAHAHVRAEMDGATIAIGEGAEFHGKVEMRGGGTGQVTFKEKRGERPNDR